MRVAESENDGSHGGFQHEDRFALRSSASCSVSWWVSTRDSRERRIKLLQSRDAMAIESDDTSTTSIAAIVMNHHRRQTGGRILEVDSSGRLADRSVGGYSSHKEAIVTRPQGGVESVLVGRLTPTRVQAVNLVLIAQGPALSETQSGEINFESDSDRARLRGRRSRVPES